ncbi:unnamed protein product [Effrenium voratum]|nr:unnamed protein product [Effrenium voratum]
MGIVGLVSSFWEGGALELAIGSSQYHRNFNFMADDLSEGWRQGAERLKPLLRVVADDDAPMRDRELVVWTAKLKDLAGLKIQPPPYEVPVIPYLQQDTLKPGRWTLQDLDTGHEFDVLVHYEPGSHAVEVQKFDGHRLEDVRHPGNIDRRRLEIRFTLEDMEWCGQVKSLGTFMPLLRVRSLKDPKQAAKNFSGTWHEEDPFVLLPAITFQLKNPLTAADHGTLTVALNQMNTRQSESNSWMQVCQEEFARLPQGLRSWSGEEGRRSGSIQPLRGVKYTDDAYDTLVDVFATRSGFVEFDQNLFISRTLQDNCLFNICPNSNKDEDGERSDCVTQFFNLFDVLAGDTRRLSEPFDERFWPQLCCGPGYDKESRPELPQLGESPDREDLAKAIGKLMAWIDAKEKSIHHSQPRPTQPLPPSKLFEKFFQIPKVAAYAGISRRSDLEKMSTTELQRKLKGAGWRFSTHLAAPELVPGRVPALAPLKYFTDSQLSVNRHTFMVQVGHRIGKHRDSRILCRLRMDVPKDFLEPYRKLLRDCQQMMASDEVELEERGTFSYGTGSWSPKSPTVGSAGKVLQNLLERLRRIEDGSSNYFMVKFKQPGIVVWAAPDAQKAWDRPGTLLFAVKLAHQPDTIVPVVVPSFDLRYPQESSWKVQKTMQMRYHDLERRIACGLEKEKAAKGNETIRRSPAAPEREEPEAVEDLNDEEALSSGSRRMAISCDSFICRLQRKAAGLPFDREQNSDWYRLVVGESFPEVRAIKGPDEVVKEYFFSKFMNLQRTLALPSELGETVLKGHVNVEKVERHEAREGHLDTCEFAVENLWTTSSFFVALTLCTFTKLDYNVDFSEIYFKIKLGAEEQLTPVFRPNAQGKIMAVYHWATFETLLPVAHELTIQAYSKAALGFDAFIGECKFDLEDRCLALKWKEFRSSTNNEFLRNHVSPGERNRFYSITAEEADESLLPWKAPEKPSSAAEGRGLEVRPTRSPGVRLPMESKVMSMKDDLNADSRVGLLRCVLDLHPQSCPEQPLLPKAQRFEIRLSIIDVDNIKVYKDFGQRNDLFVEVKFRSASLEGSEQRRSEKTDIHRWAHAFASFNERFLFDVTAPAVSCGMDFELMDFDRGVSSADLVYYPQTFSMDHLLELAYDSWSNGREPLGPIAGTVVFDSWPSTNMLTEGWRLGRCLRRRRQQRGNAAKLNLTVEILPYELAQQSPAIAGVFAPPKDRLSLQMLASDPRKTARVVLGPKLFNAIIVSVVLGTTLVVTFLIVLIVFYTQSIIQQTGG